MPITLSGLTWMSQFAPKICYIVIAAGLARLASGQNPGIQISGTLENYYIAASGANGAQHRMTWMQVIADISSHWRLVATNAQRLSANSLDETYVEFSEQNATVRAGVIRSAFGFSDWSDLWYSGIINFPMVKGGYGSSDFRFLRLDTGIQVTAGSPELQYQVGLVDANRKSRQLLPQHMDHGVVRLQTAKGPFILGLNGFKQVVGVDGDEVRAYGADLRWTAPSVQIRSEVDKIDSDDASGWGFFTDVFVRPGKSTTTRLLGRAESYKAPYKDGIATLYTTGIRQVISPNFTLSVNYAFGNHVLPAQNMFGWNVQLMTSIHF